MNKLKESIDSFIEKLKSDFLNLKSKIQSKLSKKDDAVLDDEDITEESDESSFSVEEQDLGTSTDISENIDLKKEKKSQIIRAVVIVGLVFLGLDLFFSDSGDNKKVKEVAKAKKVVKKKEDLGKKIIETHDATKEAKILNSKFSETIETELNRKREEYRPQDDAITKKLNQEKAEIQKRVKKILTQPQEEKIKAPEPIKVQELSKVNEKKIIENTKEEKIQNEPSVVKNDKPKVTASIFEKKDLLEKENPIDNTQKIESTSKTMADIIEKVAIEAKKERAQKSPEAPEYSLKGRGLVYNCELGYWACVTKEDYLRCDAVEKWGKEFKTQASCNTAEVYASNQDCYIKQVHYINTEYSKNFCKN